MNLRKQLMIQDKPKKIKPLIKDEYKMAMILDESFWLTSDVGYQNYIKQFIKPGWKMFTHNDMEGEFYTCKYIQRFILIKNLSFVIVYVKELNKFAFVSWPTYKKGCERYLC